MVSGTCVTVVSEPLDQEAGLLPHILGITHQTQNGLQLQATVLACVLEHESPSLCLRVRAPQSVFLSWASARRSHAAPPQPPPTILNVQLMFHHLTIDVLAHKPGPIPWPISWESLVTVVSSRKKIPLTDSLWPWFRTEADGTSGLKTWTAYALLTVKGRRAGRALGRTTAVLFPLPLTPVLLFAVLLFAVRWHLC